MADWQGFNMALMAYKKYQEKHGLEKKLPGILSKLSPEQLFCLAQANVNIQTQIRMCRRIFPVVSWRGEGGTLTENNFVPEFTISVPTITKNFSVFYLGGTMGGFLD